jgi:hypothetical protein
MQLPSAQGRLILGLSVRMGLRCTLVANFAEPGQEQGYRTMPLGYHLGEDCCVRGTARGHTAVAWHTEGTPEPAASLAALEGMQAEAGHILA